MARMIEKDIENKFKNKLVVEEQRDFTNPHVRFRRIKGKVVPIFNRKRIGQDTEYAGRKILKGSALLAGAGLAKVLIKRSKKFRSVANLVNKASKKIPKVNFSFSPSFTEKIINKKSFKFRVVKGTAKVTKKGVMFGLRNMGKLGVIGSAIGIGGYALGTEIQMQSAFGKDFFAVRDQHGR